MLCAMPRAKITNHSVKTPRSTVAPLRWYSSACCRSTGMLSCGLRPWERAFDEAAARLEELGERRREAFGVCFARWQRKRDEAAARKIIALIDEIEMEELQQVGELARQRRVAGVRIG